MANLLFVVHGMGIHNPPGTAESDQHGWCDSIVARLDEIAAHYSGFDLEGNRFSTQTEVVPVTYDAPFREVLARWGEQASEIQSTIVEERIRHAPRIFDWLSRLDGEVQERFFWSHVVDVLLYEYFDLIAKQIRLIVIERVLSAMERARDRSPVVRITFLAHGLGTAVLHDSLALLAAQKSDAALEGPGFRFSAAFMLANVGRILEDDIDGFRVYDSVVCPPNARKRRRFLNAYWNIRHRLDPIPAIRPFAPVDWEPQYYTDVRVGHLSDFNVHGFTHYLEHPDVHVPLIAMTTGRVSLPPKDGPYRPPALPCLAVAQRFEREARALLALVEGQKSPFELIKAATQFLAGAHQAAGECSG